MLITAASKSENLLACKSLWIIQDAIENACRWENKSPKDA